MRKVSLLQNPCLLQGFTWNKSASSPIFDQSLSYVYIDYYVFTFLYPRMHSRATLQERCHYDVHNTTHVSSYYASMILLSIMNHLATFLSLYWLIHTSRFFLMHANVNAKRLHWGFDMSQSMSTEVTRFGAKNPWYADGILVPPRFTSSSYCFFSSCGGSSSSPPSRHCSKRHKTIRVDIVWDLLAE